MATRKLKAAAKAPAKTTSKAASEDAPKARAKKATAAPAEKKQKAKTEIVALEANSFVKFGGYVNETPEEEQLFQKGDVLYIVGVQEASDDQPMMYDCIKASDVTAFQANPEDENIEGQQLAVQEVQALSGRALQDANDSYLPIPSIGDLDSIIEEAGGDLVLASQNVFGQIEQSFFYLGGILAKIKREGSYLTENGGEYEGEEAWNEFCTDNFQFSGAKGGDLARLYTTFAAIPGFEPSMMNDIGWSKVREIQRFVTEDNYQELLEDARTLTRSELKTQLTTKYVDETGRTPSGAVASRPGGSNAVKTMTLNFKLMEDAATAVQLALDEAVKVYGVNNHAEALERIIVAWAEEHVSSATKQKKISSKIEKAAKAADKAPKQKAAA
jgi:hypothetical protein